MVKFLEIVGLSSFFGSKILPSFFALLIRQCSCPSVLFSSVLFKDLFRYGLSKGEFRNVKQAVGLKDLVNVKAKDYEKLNLHRIKGNTIREEIMIKSV